MDRISATAIAVALVLWSLPATAAERAVVAQPPSKVESVLGREVRTARDEDGGRVIDLLFDDGGRVHAAVVEFGGFLGIGTRKIAVDWSAFRFGGPIILVDLSRDQLRRAPEFRANEPPSVVTPIRD